MNLAFKIVEFAKTLHPVNNASVVTFWLKLKELNLVLYVQVDVLHVQVLQIVWNVIQATLWTQIQKFVRDVHQIVGNVVHQLFVQDVFRVINCLIMLVFLTLKIVLWWTLITHVNNVLKDIYLITLTLNA